MYVSINQTIQVIDIYSKAPYYQYTCRLKMRHASITINKIVDRIESSKFDALSYNINK